MKYSVKSLHSKTWPMVSMNDPPRPRKRPRSYPRPSDSTDRAWGGRFGCQRPLGKGRALCFSEVKLLVTCGISLCPTACSESWPVSGPAEQAVVGMRVMTSALWVRTGSLSSRRQPLLMEVPRRCFSLEAPPASRTGSNWFLKP